MSIPKEKSGAGIGVFLTDAFIGGGLGVALAGWLLSFQSQSHFHRFLSHSSTQLNSIQMEQLEQIASGLIPMPTPSSTFSADLVQQLSPALHSAFMFGFNQVMWLCVGLNVVSFICSLFCKHVTIDY